MKLLRKINISYIKYSLIVFLVADVLVFLLMNIIVRDEIDQELEMEVFLIQKHIETKGSVPLISPTSFVEIIPNDMVVPKSFKDTMLYDPYQQEQEPFRECMVSRMINGQNYRIISRDMMMETDDFLEAITLTLAVLTAFIFLGLLFFSRRIHRIVWASFKDNLLRLQAYSFTNPTQLELSQTDIEEFDQLNGVLLKMSSRLEKDYTSMKEFSANAAHELQTPLAIIQGKCEGLFSQSDVSGEVMTKIHDIYLAADRLSGIVKALLLMARIENGQFDQNEEVSINDVVENVLMDLQDVFLEKEIELKVATEGFFCCMMDRRLALMLLRNLIVNSIYHVDEHLTINITIDSKGFCIANSGKEALAHPEKLFQRFYKESRHTKSIGLGLAIAKKIADASKLSISYRFANFRHIFSFEGDRC